MVATIQQAIFIPFGIVVLLSFSKLEQVAARHLTPLA
jgi:hypothetical protein